MKIKIIIIILVGLFGLFNCEDIEMKIEYNKTQDITENQNNCIGPCADTSIRSGFDCGSGGGFTYNDANTRFVKKTGDDTTGLYGHEFTTIEGAVAQAITDGVNNIAVLDSEIYEEIITSEIPASFKIVAADGLTPRLKWVANEMTSSDIDTGAGIVLGINNTLVCIKSDTPYISNNKGVTWSNKAKPGGFNVQRIFQGDNGRVFLKTYSNNTYYSDDNCDSYTSIFASPYNIMRTNTGRFLALLTSATTTYYTSDDGGDTWDTHTATTSLYRNPIGLGRGNRVFINSNGNNHLHYSDDDCETFIETNNLINYYHQYSMIKDGQGYLYAKGNTNNLLKSDDNGTSWYDITSQIGLDNDHRFQNLITPNYGYRIYITIVHITPDTIEIYYSDNNGATWNMLLDDVSISHTNIALNRLFGTGKYIPLEIIPMLNNGLEINGFYLDGNNKQSLGLISGTGSQTNLTLEYCELSNYYYKAVFNVDFATLTAQYCKITGGEHGIVPD